MEEEEEKEEGEGWENNGVPSTPPLLPPLDGGCVAYRVVPRSTSPTLPSPLPVVTTPTSRLSRSTGVACSLAEGLCGAALLPLWCEPPWPWPAPPCSAACP